MPHLQTDLEESPQSVLERWIVRQRPDEHYVLNEFQSKRYDDEPGVALDRRCYDPCHKPTDRIAYVLYSGI